VGGEKKNSLIGKQEKGGTLDIDLVLALGLGTRPAEKSRYPELLTRHWALTMVRERRDRKENLPIGKKKERPLGKNNHEGDRN